MSLPGDRDRSADNAPPQRIDAAFTGEQTARSKVARWWTRRTATEKTTLLAAALTAIATVAAGVVQAAPVILRDESTPKTVTPAASVSPAPAVSAPPSIPTVTSATVDPPNQQIICSNGDGDNNTNNCGLPPQSFGKISYRMGPVLWAHYTGDVRDLPRPKGEGSENDTCYQWGDWLTATPHVYVVDPVVDFSMEAGDTDVAVISRVEVEIFDRISAATDATPVKCLFGGGSNTFYNVTVDTAASTTMVREDSLGENDDPKPYSIPPASITLDEGGHTDVRITIDSLDGYLYQGSLVVTASLNGRESVFRIGTREQPFRWMTPDREYGMDEDFDYVGWDGTRWVNRYAPWAS